MEYYYPPKELDSFEVGFINGKFNTNRYVKARYVTSLLLSLANKGYIKIEELDTNSSTLGAFFTGYRGSIYNCFKIIKLKDYNDSDTNEKLFFDGLFKRKNFSGTDGKNDEYFASECDVSNLRFNFYKTIEKIIDNFERKNIKNKFYDKSSINKMIIIKVMIFIVYSLILISLGFSFEIRFLAIIFPMAFFLLIMLYSDIKFSIPQLFLAIIFLVILLNFFSDGMFLNTLTTNPINLVNLMICNISIVIMINILNKFPMKTKFGEKMLCEIEGFNDFLENGDENKLKELIKQDSLYFYNVLPFAYSIGKTNKLLEKFKKISLPQPQWYCNSNEFSYEVIEHFLLNLLPYIYDVLSSNPSQNV